MSKANLKKLLKDMPREEMVELILATYSARKEAKEFLDFFVDPDVEKITLKAQEVIKKEVWRVVKRYTAPRFSHVRKAIKWFESFSPGIDAVIDLRVFTLNEFCQRTHTALFKDSVNDSVVKLMNETITLADKNLMLQRAISPIVKIIEETPKRIRVAYLNTLRNDMVKSLAERGIEIQ